MKLNAVYIESNIYQYLLLSTFYLYTFFLETENRVPLFLLLNKIEKH